MVIRSSNAHSVYDGALASRPTRPLLRERYDRRQQEVVDAAARVFAERGYDRTSVPELAEAIGLAAGSLYHYFGSKEQVLIRICDELMDPLNARAQELLAADAPAAEQLRALVRLWVGHVVAHRDHMLVFQQERHMIERGAQWRGVRAARKEFERLVEGVLARVDAERAAAGPGDRASDDGARGDRRLALAALLGMVNHTAQWYRPKGRLTPQEVADGYLDLVLGVRA
jgi:TetR/AcrR family transcriptional regulator, cholesterol catabolism regulator